MVKGSKSKKYDIPESKSSNSVKKEMKDPVVGETSAPVHITKDPITGAQYFNGNDRPVPGLPPSAPMSLGGTYPAATYNNLTPNQRVPAMAALTVPSRVAGELMTGLNVKSGKGMPKAPKYGF